MLSRAADVGVSVDVYKGANSTMPAVTFRTSSSSATGANGEAYSDAEIAALYGGNGTLVAKVTTYDVFTLTVGGQSVTATVAAASVTGNGSLTGGAAASAIAIALEDAWNAKFGDSGTASKTLSFWADAKVTATAAASNVIAALAQKDEGAGSRPYGQTIAISHAKATAAQASLATGGAITNTFADWTIGATQATTDNAATATDLIISVEEVTEGVIDAIGTGSGQMTISMAGGTSLVELSTLKLYNTTQSVTTSTDIFEDDAGMYGSIYSGGAGDVRNDQTVDEGLQVVTTSGNQRGLITRLHWLGS